MNTEIGQKLINSNDFWLKKRILFNVLVGAAGLAIVFKFYTTLNSFDYFGILVWGLVANAFYSFGYVLESATIKFSKGKNDFSKSRAVLFWLGTICYSVATYIFGNIYFYYSIAPE